MRQSPYFDLNVTVGARGSLFSDGLSDFCGVCGLWSRNWPQAVSWCRWPARLAECKRPDRSVDYDHDARPAILKTITETPRRPCRWDDGRGRSATRSRGRHLRLSGVAHLPRRGPGCIPSSSATRPRHPRATPDRARHHHLRCRSSGSRPARARRRCCGCGGPALAPAISTLPGGRTFAGSTWNTLSGPKAAEVCGLYLVPVRWCSRLTRRPACTPADA